MGLQSTQQVWKSGTILCISIPQKIRAILGIDEGDYLQIDWLEIIKKVNLKGKVYSRKINKKINLKQNINDIATNKDGLDDILPTFEDDD